MEKRSLLVVGLGHFGMNFLKAVRGGGFEVLAVDQRESAVDRVASWVARAVVADATDRESLETLGVENMDAAVVSMGGSIDRSILTVLHLKGLGVREICVKAVSEDHAKILRLIGATRIIHPEREVAELLAESLKHPSLRKYLPLLGEFAIVETTVPAGFVGKTLAELHLRRRHGVSVIAVGPAPDPSKLKAPSAEEPLAAGDHLLLIGDKSALERFERNQPQ